MTTDVTKERYFLYPKTPNLCTVYIKLYLIALPEYYVESIMLNQLWEHQSTCMQKWTLLTQMHSLKKFKQNLNQITFDDTDVEVDINEIVVYNIWR